MMTTLISAVAVVVAWVAWGSLLFARVYPITNDELCRKIEDGTLEPGESREALRVLLLLPLVLLVRWLAFIGGRECSRRATNYVALRWFKLPG